MSGFDRIPAAGSYRIKAGATGAYILPDRSTGGVAIGNTGTSYTTFNSWFQITASTPSNALFVMVNMWAQSLGYLYSVQIGVGAAGSEVPVFDTAFVQGGYANDNTQTFMLPIPVYVPSGSRMAMRATCTQGSAQNVSVVLTMVPTASLETY